MECRTMMDGVGMGMMMFWGLLMLLLALVVVLVYFGRHVRSKTDMG